MEISGIGYYFKDFFENKCNHFEEVEQSHTFSDLSESNKGGKAYRKGVYITKVDSDLNFRLLRCSTNMNSPTENFRSVDLDIVEKLNEKRKEIYPNSYELNHVLAQIYYNQIVNNKERKAKIKEHSDKTKDMPDNAIIAFCTFYKEKCTDPDKLTTLRFKLKKPLTGYKDCIDIKLEHNSVLMISLETNRLYTHSIVPSKLNCDKLPTRMGYVVRSSNVEAQYINDKVYIKEDSGLVELQKITEEDINELRSMYYKENSDTDKVTYPKIYYSMNNGDYMKPVL
jgi:hypothetical protein